MTETTASAQKTTDRTEPRNVIVRRFVTRVLRWAVDSSFAFFSAVLLALVLVWLAGAGPAWIALASEWEVIGYAIIVYGINRLFDGAAETIAYLLDPDRFDGDIFFEMFNSLHTVHADIRNGADTDDVLDSLVASNVTEELSDIVRSISQQYAARGDEDQVQRLMAVVLHLRRASENLGYGTLNAHLDAIEHSRADAS
ncbi:hypothetical protein [Streptomyces chartreusis]|uniref:hypothetical protein n=1 Tax=Streptomyces chartreusis TaxID=1969 RepID=UPI0037F77D5A